MWQVISWARGSESVTWRHLLHHIRFASGIVIKMAAAQPARIPERLAKAESCFQPATEIQHRQKEVKLVLNGRDFKSYHDPAWPVTIPHTEVCKN